MSDKLPKNAILIGRNPEDFPPWTDAQRDAQIEALRFAYCDLAKTLHEQGVLDMQEASASLSSSEWLFEGNSPGTLKAVRWLAGTLDYMRTKQGPLVRGRRKATKG